MKKINNDLQAQDLLINCIHHLLNSEDFNSSVSSLLHTILDYYDGDRAYIFNIKWQNSTATNTYEACRNSSITPQIQNLQSIPIDYFDAWTKSFSENAYIIIEDVDKLPPTRQGEYNILKPQGIKSLIVVPYFLNKKLDGFLGVDNPKINCSDIAFLTNLTYFLTSEIRNKQLRDKLMVLSYRDSLTGLQNRNKYNEYLVSCENKIMKKVGVCFCDINGLKKMNDNFGHDYGDTVIRYVGNKIYENFKTDTTFRISGDEFVIICNDISYKNFHKKVDTLESIFKEKDAAVASCGAVWSSEVQDIKNELKKADNLMYIHKNEFYANENIPYSHKAGAYKKILNSLLQKEYFVYLQPKLNIETNQIDSAECLVRYKDIEGNIISPNKFIPVLEKEKLISKIDFFVLETVCSILEKWAAIYKKKISVSLNFSKITIFEKNYLSKLLETCKKYNISHDQLEIEVTETQESYDSQLMQIILSQLKQFGFKISLDDFGVGYSSYSILKKCHFDTIKLDISLINGISNDLSEQIIVESIINLCKKIGSKSLAEGVEEKEDLEKLKSFGCNYIQGFIISKPMPIEEYEKKYLMKNDSVDTNTA